MTEPGPRDTPVRVPLTALLATAALVLLTALAIGGLMVGAWQPPPRTADPIPPAPVARPDAPALQRDPAAELDAFEARQRRRLGSVDWVDREAGIVRMPIERAMTLLVARGPGTDSAFEPATPATDEAHDR